MDIPLLVFAGGTAVVVIVSVILASQRRAAAGFADIATARAAWQRTRPAIAAHLEPEAYRTADDGGKQLSAVGGHVGRIVAVQRPRRAQSWRTVLPDVDVQTVADLVEAHQQVQQRGMLVEARLRAVVASQKRTAEERRIMTRAFRRWVLGWTEDAITRLLVDPKVSAKRRLAAHEAVAAGIALVDDRGELGDLTERFVEALQRADAVYPEARRLLRG